MSIMCEIRKGHSNLWKCMNILLYHSCKCIWIKILGKKKKKKKRTHLQVSCECVNIVIIIIIISVQSIFKIPQGIILYRLLSGVTDDCSNDNTITMPVYADNLWKYKLVLYMFMVRNTAKYISVWWVNI